MHGALGLACETEAVAAFSLQAANSLGVNMMVERRRHNWCASAKASKITRWGYHQGRSFETIIHAIRVAMGECVGWEVSVVVQNVINYDIRGREVKAAVVGFFR